MSFASQCSQNVPSVVSMFVSDLCALFLPLLPNCFCINCFYTPTRAPPNSNLPFYCFWVLFHLVSLRVSNLRIIVFILIFTLLFFTFLVFWGVVQDMFFVDFSLHFLIVFVFGGFTCTCVAEKLTKTPPWENQG